MSVTQGDAGGGRSRHYVSDEPFDPYSVEQLTPAQERYYMASQWQLMWWKLKRHRLGVWCGFFILGLYAMALFVEPIAPYNLHERQRAYVLTVPTQNDEARALADGSVFAPGDEPRESGFRLVNKALVYVPPQAIYWFHEGELTWPFTYGLKLQRDPETLARIYTNDTERRYPLRFFCSGDTYRFWGLFETDFHFVCPGASGTMFLLGTDRLGRDMLSRIIYGARISLSIGLVGIALSFMLGIVIGGIAGYYGGLIDNIVQRIIEIVRSFPNLPLWLALSAALPVTWSPILVYFGITIILALLDWPGLARAVRSKLLALREEDFATAARLMGARPNRIIARHLLPGFMSHLIASATLSIPTMILAETALSFLGLGLRPPITSWGVLLNEATNINAVATTPWLLTPAIPVIMFILAFQYLGDGLRDAADPYK
jgi:peptide/nickel transport system permease protein